jgi:hypothetical protein
MPKTAARSRFGTGTRPDATGVAYTAASSVLFSPALCSFDVPLMLTSERLHRVLIDVVGDRLALGIADGDGARVVHPAPDPGVVSVLAACVMLVYVRLGCPVAVNVNDWASLKLLSRTVAAAPLRLGCPAGYSGCEGVLISGSQSGSEVVSGLPSVSARGIAVTGRQVTSVGRAP